VNKKYLYIILILCLFSQKAFSLQRDSLNVDTNGQITIHRLPENFKEKYDGREFIYEYNQSDELSWSERLSRWFYNLLLRIFDFKPTQQGLKVTGYIIKALYYIALVTIIFFIVRAIVRKEGYWVFGKKTEKLDILTEDIEINLLETDFDVLINDAVNNKKYNLATRYYYLKILKTLNEKEIIVWDTEKTNTDYLMEIKSIPLQKQFRYISYIYDYCWYGEFMLDADSYREAETGFKSLLKSVI